MLSDGSDVDRFQTMSLGTQGACTIGSRKSEGRRANLNIVSNVTDVSDIRGTKPLMKAYQYTNRPKLWDNTSDVKGARSKILHPKNPNKVIGRNLTNDDIEGSKPQLYTFQTQRRSNPVQPDYAVPGHSEPVPANPPPKQIHHTNQTADIDGAKPSVPLSMRYAMRDHHGIGDIEGSSTTWRPRHQRRQEWAPRNTSYDCKDINDKRGWTNRVSDPLDPVHVIHGRTIDGDPKSKPKPLPQARDGGAMPVLSLLTQDIEGAVPGWKPKHQNGGIPEEYRRHFRNINYIGDIKGAKADSLVRNMPNYGRQTDPLDPSYTDLDGAALMPSARAPASAPAPETDATDLDDSMAPTMDTLASECNENQSVPAAQSAQWAQPRRSKPINVWAAPEPEPAAPAVSVSEGQRQAQEQQYDRMISTLQEQKQQEQDRVIGELQQEINRLKAERDDSYYNNNNTSRGSSRGSVQSRGSAHSRGSVQSRGSRSGSRSGSRGSVHSYDRMVLKSRNGQPRVPMTPAERRAEADLAADIASIRGL